MGGVSREGAVRPSTLCSWAATNLASLLVREVDTGLASSLPSTWWAWKATAEEPSELWGSREGIGTPFILSVFGFLYL